MKTRASLPLGLCTSSCPRRSRTSRAAPTSAASRGVDERCRREVDAHLHRTLLEHAVDGVLRATCRTPCRARRRPPASRRPRRIRHVGSPRTDTSVEHRGESFGATCRYERGMSAFSESTVAATAASPAAEPAWRPRPGKLIGDVIVEQGFAPREAVESAAVAGREEGKQLGQVLIERGQLTPEQLGQSVALRFNLEYVEILNHQLDAVAVSMVDGAVARRLEVLPIGFADDGQLRVAMANPSNVLAIDDLAMMTGRSIMPVVASREDILTACWPRLEPRGRRAGGRQDEAEPTAEESLELRESADDAPTDQARALDHRPGGRAGRVRRPLRPRGRRLPGPLPHRRRHARRRPRAQAHGRLGRLAHQDPREPRHRRAPPAAGRPHRPDDRRPPHRPARRRAAARRRRVGRAAHPGLRQRAADARGHRHARARPRPLQHVAQRSYGGILAAARRAPASHRRSTPRCCRSPRARRRSSRSRTRSSTASTASARSRSTRRPA